MGEVGQVTDSAGTRHPLTDLGRLESQLARKQRLQARKRKGPVRARRRGGQLTKLRRKQKRIRSHDTHHLSRALADQAHTLVAEELQTHSMTKSAKGTQDSPGTNVQAKCGPEPQYMGQQLGPAGPAASLQVWSL